VINHILFPPSQVVKWLGYWLTPTLHSSVPFLRRLALAKASFTTIRQLSAAGKGLSSWCHRKLVFGAILPILTYGCDLFVPDAATLRKFDTFWHAVSSGQVIAFTPPPSVLGTGRPRFHPFPPYANTAVGQLPSAWSEPLRNSTLPPPGSPNLCPPGTRVVLRTIIAFSSVAPPKPSTLLHGLPRRLILPSTYH